MKMRKNGFIRAPFWIVNCIIILIFSFAMVMIITQFEDSLLENTDLQYYTLSQRIFNSRHCFAYHNSVLKRTTPGTIDLQKFNQDRMDECFSFPNEDVDVGVIIKLPKHSENTLYFNEDKISDYKNLHAKARSIYYVEKDFLVLVKNDQEENLAIMTVGVGWHTK